MSSRIVIFQAVVLLALLQPLVSTPVPGLQGTETIPTRGPQGSEDVKLTLIHNGGSKKSKETSTGTSVNRELDTSIYQRHDGNGGPNDSLMNSGVNRIEDTSRTSVHALEMPPFEPELRRRLRSQAEEEESAGADDSYEYSAEAVQGSDETASETNDGDNADNTTVDSNSDNTENTATNAGDAVDGASENAVSASSRMIRPMEGNEQSSTSSNRHADTNLEHVSKMVLKIVKKYKIRSMVDIPCRNSLEFMPALLNRIDFEVPGFKYYCIDTERDSHDDIAHLFGDAANPDIIHMRPEEASTMPKSELVFSWDGPQDWGVTRFWSFLMHIRQIRPNYILITNNPGEVNGDKANVLNLRKQPFHFAQATRVVNNISRSVSPKKQLLFYEIGAIRRGF